jgi:hypothetical protein
LGRAISSGKVERERLRKKRPGQSKMILEGKEWNLTEDEGLDMI